MKKLIAAVLFALMLVSLLGGCQSASQTSPSPTLAASPTTATSPAATESTAPAEPVTITLALPLYNATGSNASGVSPTDTPNYKAIQQILKDKFNIDYQIQVVPASTPQDYETALSTMFASGDLPDIIDYAYSPDKLVNLYQNGSIISLNDLVAQSPDIQKIFDEYPYMKIAASDSDGNILRVPAEIAMNPQHEIRVLSLRQDWLDRLGMPMPQTPDDLYNFLKACQDQDLNGDGKKNEVLEANGALGGLQVYQVLATAFGVPNLNEGGSINSWYFDSNGKVYSTVTMPQTKDFLTYMNKLYSEGLIDQNYQNLTGDSYNQLLNSNCYSAFTGYWWDGYSAAAVQTNAGVADATYTPVVPPIAAPGTQPMVYNLDLAGYDGYMITKNCKNPQAAMEVLNYGYSPEGSCQNYYGEQYPGGDYYAAITDTQGTNPLPTFMMEYTQKGTDAFAADPNLWAKMGWNTEMIPLCFIGNADAVALEASTYPQLGKIADIQFVLKGLTDATTTYKIPGIDFANPTADQASQFAGYADLWTYMDQELAKFITGAEPLSNWDSFVAKCQSMGLDGATAIKQAEYDSAMSQLNK